MFHRFVFPATTKKIGVDGHALCVVVSFLVKSSGHVKISSPPFQPGVDYYENRVAVWALGSHWPYFNLVVETQLDRYEAGDESDNRENWAGCPR